MATPLTITLYDPETDEIKKKFTRSFVPWAILKQAIRLQNAIDLEQLKPEDVDELAGLVVAAFGDQFTVEEASNGVDISEMITVLTAIVNRAANLAPAMGANPTRPAS